MPLALLTRPLQAQSWSWPPFRGDGLPDRRRIFAATDNGGRAHLLEHWAATPDADRLAFLEALATTALHRLDSRQQPFILGADQRFQAAEGDALPDGEAEAAAPEQSPARPAQHRLASHQLVANEALRGGRRAAVAENRQGRATLLEARRCGSRATLA